MLMYGLARLSYALLTYPTMTTIFMLLHLKALVATPWAHKLLFDPRMHRRKSMADMSEAACSGEQHGFQHQLHESDEPSGERHRQLQDGPAEPAARACVLPHTAEGRQQPGHRSHWPGTPYSPRLHSFRMLKMRRAAESRLQGCSSKNSPMRSVHALCV